MIIENSPKEWKRRIEKLSEEVHKRSRGRLETIFFGILFAHGKRTVTSWLKAAGITKGYQEYYFFLNSLGKHYYEKIADKLCEMVLRVALWNSKEMVGVIDDSPTRRFGPKVEGAGKHHDHTTKPTDQKFFYGHVWVTLALILKHCWYGTIALPLLSKLYIRKKDVKELPKEYGWKFKTKLVLAWELVEWLYEKCIKWGKDLWILTDGGYSKGDFLKKIPKDVKFVGRLRRDAALRPLPEKRKPHQKGRTPVYGKKRIHLRRRAGQERGWQTAMVGGKERKFKAFQATYRHVKGPILVVMVSFPNGTWAPYFCTDSQAEPIKVLEKIFDRCAIEDNFKEVKETLGAGEQQVRNLWSNIACWHLCLWSYVLVYLWSWRKSHTVLVKECSLGFHGEAALSKRPYGRSTPLFLGASNF